jgi:phenylacetic acid degradation operon negative regulatory protein
MSQPLLRPVSARSALLSLLLGTDGATRPGADLVAAMALLDVSEATTRVALSRMVAAGDLVRDGGDYSLSERLLERQRELEAVHAPSTRAWRGTWEMAVITATGRSAADRAALRAQLTQLRVAELREGVWTRPANLRRPWPPELLAISICFESRPIEDAAELAARLWDLDGWAAGARELLDALAAESDAPRRFALMTGIVRHLQADPILPPELEPVGWPGAALRASYDDYRAWLWAMRPVGTGEASRI